MTSVVVEGPWVDRRRPARVEALEPVVGRHAAAGPSPEVVALVDRPHATVTRLDRSCTDDHLARHALDRAAADAVEPDPRPLVRELEDLVGRMARYGPLLGLQSELRALLGAWAAALVRLHRTPLTHGTPAADVPWVLVEPLPDWLDDLPAETGPVWAVRAHPGVQRALRRTRADWTAAQWTHGDPTGDEVVVTRRHGITRATLLGAAHHEDAEQEPPCGQPRSGMGDPRWDVATALDWVAIALGPALDPAWQLDPVRLFLDEYLALGGNAVPTRAMAVARTVATAIEWSAQLALAGPDGPETQAWLAGLWGRPLELAGRR